MVISFNQGMKERIESQGIMVIEYKRRLYKAFNVNKKISEWLNRVNTIIKRLTEVLQTFFGRTFKAIYEQIKSAIDSICAIAILAKIKYEPVFKYMKCNKPYTGVRRIDIRCRSRC